MIFKPGGIRLGTSAVTTRGMKEEEMLEIADLLAESARRARRRARHRQRAPAGSAMTRRFPLPD
jgi:glycine hydroxymethyltransferase